MEVDGIPEQLQIDAALTGRLWNLVHRFRGGAWGQLASHWTVSFEDIVAEANRRGLDVFVSSRPASEGFWLLQTERGYVVCFNERGACTDHKEFAELEPAFRHWLDQNLRGHLLPVNSGYASP